MGSIGRDFFERMFQRQPEMLKLFNFRDDPNYASSRSLMVSWRVCYYC